MPETPTAKRVLIVGDTPRWKKTALAAIPDGCHVRVGTDYIDALGTLFKPEGVGEERFDLHILAHQMPEKNNGLGILTELREDGQTGHVIIFSDHVDRETVSKIAELGGIVISRKNGGAKLAAKVAGLLIA